MARPACGGPGVALPLRQRKRVGTSCSSASEVDVTPRVLQKFQMLGA